MINNELFEKNGYVIIRGMFLREFMQFINLYIDMHIDRCAYKEDNNYYYHHEWDGGFDPHEFGDQVRSSYFFHYGSTISETLMLFILQKLESELKLKLNPTYSYLRVYQQNNILEKHTDRPSCEISVTLPISSDCSNLDYDYVWPIYFIDRGNNKIKVELNPGDIVVYRGNELVHWRDEFLGNYQTQLMMHYTDSTGPYQDLLFDKRPRLATRYLGPENVISESEKSK